MHAIMCKPCERCDDLALHGERYCKACKKAVLQELAAAGYLQPRPYMGRYRSPSRCENTWETKHGP
jgi:hypothetical protein